MSTATPSPVFIVFLRAFISSSINFAFFALRADETTATVDAPTANNEDPIATYGKTLSAEFDNFGATSCTGGVTVGVTLFTGFGKALKFLKITELLVVKSAITITPY